jgi:phosphopantothenoylcysteine decarboxylase/phosphopantothenate--cysteine ligase
MGQMKMDGRLKEGALLVGFAAETSNIESNAVDKLQRKGADFIVANDVSRADIGFESDNNEISIFQRTQTGVELLRHIDKASKIGVARQIIDCLGDTF